MKIKPVSVAIIVKNRKRAAKWYTQKLGLKVLEDEDDHWTVVGRKAAGLRIHLCEQDGRLPNPEEADTGILLTVDKPLPKVRKALVKAGVEFELEPKETSAGWISRIRDPDGNLLWLVPDA
jgi:catechol 2,3-dioxygenase-like lactoylglutathione lyase family enzyme